MSKDWWDTGDGMFNENYSPFDELNRLRAESISQRATITQLINHNNKLQDLLVELSNQHQQITSHYTSMNQRLNHLTNELNTLKSKSILVTNDLESNI